MFFLLLRNKSVCLGFGQPSRCTFTLFDQLWVYYGYACDVAGRVYDIFYLHVITRSHLHAISVIISKVQYATLALIFGGFLKGLVFKRMDWRNTTLVPGDYLWCRCSAQYFLVML